LQRRQHCVAEYFIEHAVRLEVVQRHQVIVFAPRGIGVGVIAAARLRHHRGGDLLVGRQIVRVFRIALRLHIDQDVRKAEREFAGQEFVARVGVEHVYRSAVAEIHHDLREVRRFPDQIEERPHLAHHRNGHIGSSLAP